MEECKHGNPAPIDVMEQIPSYQGKSGRHACPYCAYNAGIEDAIGAAGKAFEKSIREALNSKKPSRKLRLIQHG